MCVVRAVIPLVYFVILVYAFYHLWTSGLVCDRLFKVIALESEREFSMSTVL